MAGVFDLGDVFQLVIDRFNQGTLSQQQLVLQSHQPILHVLFDGGNQLQVLIHQLLPQGFGNVSLVPKQSPVQIRHHVRDGATIVGVACG